MRATVRTALLRVKFPLAAAAEHNGRRMGFGAAFLHAFVALFVAVDAIGIAPIYFGLLAAGGATG